jgi:hypothetical protein
MMKTTDPALLETGARLTCPAPPGFQSSSADMNDSPDIIAILEDSLDRMETFRRIVESLPVGLELRHFDHAGEMQSRLPADFAKTRLISLDYSLEGSRSDSPWPGSGMDAVAFLIRLDPVCPVIVHTSSPGQSCRMAEALAGAGWTVRRVDFGSPDRKEKWREAVMELLETRA